MTGQKKFWGLTLLKSSWLILKSCKLRSLTNLVRKPFISGGRSEIPTGKKYGQLAIFNVIGQVFITRVWNPD